MGYYFCEKQNQQLGITVHQTARKVFKYSLTNSVPNIQTGNRQFMDLHFSVWIAFYLLQGVQIGMSQISAFKNLRVYLVI